MEKGKLFVIEGACDGIGKSTQMCLLNDRLESEGIKVTNHHFPSYDTYHGKPVEMYLKGDYGSPEELSPYFVNGLYAMDRAIAWHTKLKEKYEQGETILLDRYTTSSLIYQSALVDDIGARKEFIDFMIDFEYEKLGTKEPNSVVFLHAPFDLVTAIRGMRGDNGGVKNDVYERDLELMRKIYNNAMFVADYLNWDGINCAYANKLKTIDEIHEDIYKLIKSKY